MNIKSINCKLPLKERILRGKFINKDNQNQPKNYE